MPRGLVPAYPFAELIDFTAKPTRRQRACAGNLLGAPTQPWRERHRGAMAQARHFARRNEFGDKAAQRFQTFGDSPRDPLPAGLAVEAVPIESLACCAQQQDAISDPQHCVARCAFASVSDDLKKNVLAQRYEALDVARRRVRVR
jgi:hypothetical protein